MSTFECNNQESNNNSTTHHHQHPFTLFNNTRSVILRYGREELIALYRPHLPIPDEIKDIPEIFSKQELTPFSLSPASETEQRNLTQALCGRVSVNFKTNPQRPHGNRLILNSSNRYPRTTSSNTSNPYFHQSKSVDWSGTDAPLSSPDANFDDTSSPGEMSNLFMGHSEAFNRLSRNKDSNRRVMDKRFLQKGGSVIAGSWRNSGNLKTDSSQRKDFFSNENDDQLGLPEWATESASPADSKDMTFDNQGKFVHVDALEESEKKPSDDQVLEEKSMPPPQPTPIEEPPPVDSAPKSENDPVGFDINLLRKHIDALTTRDTVEQQQPQKKPMMMAKTVEWFYIDPQQQIRGPFSAEQMSKWYSAGYFTSAILLRRSTDSKFSHLGDYINALGPGFLFSHAPIRGFSEMIDAGLLNARSIAAGRNSMQVPQMLCQPRGYLPGMNAMNVRHDAHLPRAAAGGSLEGLLLDLLSQNQMKTQQNRIAAEPKDASTDGIVERLGFSDPSIMAISARGSQDANTSVVSSGAKDNWQIGKSDLQNQMTNSPVCLQQPENKLAPWANQVETVSNPPKSLTAIQMEELQLAKQFQMNRAAAQMSSSGVEDHQTGPVWRTMSHPLSESFSKIQLEEMRRHQAGLDMQRSKENDQLVNLQPENKLAPWANQVETVSNPPKSLTAIQMEELQLAKQLQMNRAAQKTTSVEKPPPLVWRTMSNPLNESFSKIQLEEMRRHQAGLDENIRQPQFQQEGLHRLRQLQKPQESKGQENLNWANWSTRSAKIWEQELRNYHIRQAEEEQASRKPKSFTSNMNPSLVSWASEQLTSMYGPKIYADAVIHLLCKFNTASEMESFIRQSLGTHSKATEFSLNFHKRLLSNENVADETPQVNIISKEQSDSNPAVESMEAGRSNSPSATKRRNKRKGKRVHDSQLGFKPSSAE